MLKQPYQGESQQQMPELFSYINKILSQKKLIFLFPSVLEKQFVAKRAAESQAFINTGRYLLIVLFLVIVANVTFFFKDIVLDNNYQIIKETYIPLSAAIVFILFSPFIKIVRHNFYYFMAPCAVFVLHHIIFLSLRYENDYSDLVIYHLMMAIILMAFGLRFVLPLFVAILVVSGVVSTVYANWIGLHINSLYTTKKYFKLKRP